MRISANSFGLPARKNGFAANSAPIVLGTNVFGWNVDEKTSFAILDAFTEAGFNAVDTANAYSRWVPGHTGGESETIIGTWVKRSGNRRYYQHHEVVLIRRIRELLYEQGFTISGARNKLDGARANQVEVAEIHAKKAEGPDMAFLKREISEILALLA